MDSLHGSLLSKEGKTVALIGDCGRGKSTLASQLISHGWQLLGDDLIVLIQIKIEVTVFGFSRGTFLNSTKSF